jgi:hypothetical protein
MKKVCHTPLAAAVALIFSAQVLATEVVINTPQTEVVYGNSTDGGVSVDPAVSTSGNALTFTGDIDIAKEVYVGYARGTDSDANNNTLTLSGGSFHASVYGGHTTTGAAHGNRIVVDGKDNAVALLGDVIAGLIEAGSGTAEGNVVDFITGTAQKRVIAAFTAGATARGNKVNVSGGTLADVYGAYVENGLAHQNEVNLDGGYFTGNEPTRGGVYGAFSDKGTALENVVNVNGGDFNVAIYGGGTDHNGTAKGNVANLNDGTVRSLTGGIAYEGTATGNVVNLIGGTVSGNVTGGESNIGDAIGNAVNVGASTMNGSTISGGLVYKDEASDNVVNINDKANLNGVNIYGGRANLVALPPNEDGSPATPADAPTPTLSGNVVNINAGATLEYVTIYGAHSAARAGEIKDNVVNVNGGNFVNSVELIGGMFERIGSSDTPLTEDEIKKRIEGSKGNTLNLNLATMQGGIESVRMFQTINFRNEASQENGDTAPEDGGDENATWVDPLFARVDSWLNAKINTLNIGNGEIAGYGTTLNTNDYDIEFDGHIMGQKGDDLIKTGRGTLLLSGHNYFRHLRVNGGTVRFTHEDALNDGADEGTCTEEGGTAINCEINTGNKDDGIGTVEIAYVGDFDREVSGEGHLRFDAGDSAENTITTSQSYTGATVLRSGTLTLAENVTLKSTELWLYENTVFNGNHNLAKGSLFALGKNVAYNGALSLAEDSTLEFYVTGEMDWKDRVLNYNDAGALNLNGAKVGLYFAPNFTLAFDAVVGDPDNYFDLLTAKNGIDGDWTTDSAVLNVGALIEYRFKVNGVDGDSDGVNDTLRATLSTAGAKESAKAVSEGFLAGTAMVNAGGDIVANEGMRAATNALAAGTSAFGSLGTQSVKHKTGSHVDISAVNLIVGAAHAHPMTAGNFMGGVFFEHGKGSYDTVNDFADFGRINGDGDTDYFGGGLMMRFDFSGNEKGHSYVEGSLRYGKVSNEYRSPDLNDGNGNIVSYDAKATYYGAHLGGGHVFNLSERMNVDTYVKAFFTRQGGDDVVLSTGYNGVTDEVSFDAVTSTRLRVGGRFTARTSPLTAPYVGVAYEQSFGGKAKARVNEIFEIDAPELNGGTGIAEIGFTLAPDQNYPLSYDFGVSGFVGKKEGYSAGMRVRFEF